MSTSLLFDAPGPLTRARHRIYAVVTVIALIAAVAGLIWKLYASGQFAYALWEPYITPAYVQAMLTGLLDTLKMAFTAILGALVFGLVFGLGKLSDHAILRWPSWLVVEFFRAVPVLMLMIFFFYAVFGGLSLRQSSYWGVVAALTVYNGAVLAEVLRAGIAAVPKGQGEAAYALGMRKGSVMTLIMLPQAVKIMIPAIISQAVVALKDTTLGFFILAPGLTYVGRSIYLEFGNHVPTVIVLTTIYVGVNLILTTIATWVQKKYVGVREVLSVSAAANTGTGGPSMGARP